MNILGNILPGLREIRAPVIAGYIWLLTLWVALDPNIHRRPRQRVFGSIYDLHSDIGRAGVIVAVSVSAYLIGALSEGISDLFVSRLTATTAVPPTQPAPRRRRQSSALVTPGGLLFGAIGASVVSLVELLRLLVPPISAEQSAAYRRRVGRFFANLTATATGIAAGFTSIGRDLVTLFEPRAKTFDEVWETPYVQQGFRRAITTIDRYQEASRSQELTERVRAAAFAELREQSLRTDEEAIQELKLPATVLVGDKPELFAEVDRLRAEGGLRTTVAFPLAALVTELAVMQRPIWLLGLVPLAVMFALGLQRIRKSQLVIRDAISMNRITSPAETRYSAWLSDFLGVRLPRLYEGATEEFFLIRAIWGTDESHRFDASSRLQELIRDGRLEIVATNEVMGNDPDYGKAKTLTIEYMSHGQPMERSFNENTRVVLP